MVVAQYEVGNIRLVPLYNFYQVHISDFYAETSIYLCQYEKWMHDQEVCKYNSHGLFFYSKSELIDYMKNQENNKNQMVWAILIQRENKNIYGYDFDYIGHVSLQRIDWINRSAEFAIIIGEKEYWGKGIGLQVAEIVLGHGFEKLNLNRIWTGTAATNAGMNKICKKLGMFEEGVFRDGMYLEGEYVNVNAYGLLQSDWSFMHSQPEEVVNEIE